MAIILRQGTPGSGKSACAVAEAIDHLRAGGVVAANFSLNDGWAQEIARRGFGAWGADERVLNGRAKCLHDRFFTVRSVDAIKSIEPRKLTVKQWRDDGSYREGFGLLLIDEGQLVFNSRQWNNNNPWIEFFTQHRKLGWNVVVIAHSIEMIDKQIRPLFEYEERFRNLQKVRIPFIGIPLSPFPLFLVIRRYAGLGAGVSTICKREMFPLPMWAAKLYNSLDVFSREGWGEEKEAKKCGEVPALPRQGSVPVPSRAYLSTPSDCLWKKAEEHF